MSEKALSIIPTQYLDTIKEIGDDLPEIILTDSKSIPYDTLVDQIESHLTKEQGVDFLDFKNNLREQNSIPHTKFETLSYSTSKYGISSFTYEDHTYHILVNLETGDYKMDQAFVALCETEAERFDTEQIELQKKAKMRKLMMIAGGILAVAILLMMQFNN